MKTNIHISIRQRIYWSFFLLVALFVSAAVITNSTLINNRKLSSELIVVVDPSLEALVDFRKLMMESKMYTTNWVFLRYKEDDKKQLKKLHKSGYPAIKERINKYSSLWADKNWIDSLNNIYKDFEELLKIEKSIMVSLEKFSDYDDPVIKLEAERKVEDEILPRSATLLSALSTVYKHELNVRTQQNVKLENSWMKLRTLIIFFIVIIIVAAVFLSLYLTKMIIAPVRRICEIINDLGKGITRKIDYHGNGDEIGIMVRSVNNLSENLQATANFAHEVGMRNFKVPFKPLSDEDTMGKALLSMRENLRKGEINLEVKNRELERKNKELEQFAYVASHDLQEPLRTITSFVDLLHQQYQGKLDEKADKYLGFIVQSSARMQVFITDLLEYSRIGHNKEMKEVCCNAVLKEVMGDLAMTITETGAIIESDELPVITGYPTEIKQLFQHLIVNAIKFRRDEIIPRIKITAHREGDYWQFEFSDNAKGIAKEHYERIFIIFQRLHSRDEYPGSGIGLSHCKKIVELHKGKIWLHSELRKGTIFYFTIQYQHL